MKPTESTIGANDACRRITTRRRFVAARFSGGSNDPSPDEANEDTDVVWSNGPQDFCRVPNGGATGFVLRSGRIPIVWDIGPSLSRRPPRNWKHGMLWCRCCFLFRFSLPSSMSFLQSDNRSSGLNDIVLFCSVLCSPKSVWGVFGGFLDM